MSRILEQLNVPIVLAPMAGGPGTVELAGAVCGAGGLGFLPAAYRTLAQVKAEVHALRARTSRPFGVNVFVMHETEVDHAALDAYVHNLAPEARRLGAPLGTPRFDDDDWVAKVNWLLEARVPVVSFTFGCPAESQVDAIHAGGAEAWVTVTSLHEASLALGAGADALVAQGVEAGGHRGSFHDDGGEGALGVRSLVTELCREVGAPVIAAGGIAVADDVQSVLDLGAAAAQVGTAFLLADEAGTTPVHRAVLGTGRATALTRAFTGRTARGIENTFIRTHPGAPSAFPHVHFATASMRALARAAGDAEACNVWAGVAHDKACSGPAADIVRRLTPD